MAGSTHIPERTCLVCRKKAPKADMNRVVLHQGEAKQDKTQKMPGRGVYVCSQDCYNKVEGNLVRVLQRKKR